MGGSLPSIFALILGSRQGGFVHFAVQLGDRRVVLLLDRHIARDSVLVEKVEEFLVSSNGHGLEFLLRPCVHLNRSHEADVHLR